MRNARFYCVDAGDFMTAMVGDGETADVLLMDPPRAGSSPAFLRAAAKLAPKKIVYISCNPQTQVRDIRYLIKNGYKIKKAVPFDLFPQTSHVESVVLMSRSGS